MKKSGDQEDRPPRRRFEVTIRLDGDDWTEVLRRLDEVAGHLPEHGSECSLLGGGVSVFVAQNPEMTAERYAKEIIAWGDRRRARKAARNE